MFSISTRAGNYVCKLLECIGESLLGRLPEHQRLARDRGMRMRDVRTITCLFMDVSIRYRRFTLMAACLKISPDTPSPQAVPIAQASVTSMCELHDFYWMTTRLSYLSLASRCWLLDTCTHEHGIILHSGYLRIQHSPNALISQVA